VLIVSLFMLILAHLILVFYSGLCQASCPVALKCFAVRLSPDARQQMKCGMQIVTFL